MTTISPSILACDFLNLQTEVESFEKSSDLWLHLDVMDGHYVPNLTFGYAVLKDLHTKTKHKLDAHFMVTNPEQYILQFKDIGIHNFSFHWEAVTHHDSIISEIKKHYPSVGIAINPGTSVKVIPDYILKQINLILVMSVNPGFGGQSFIDSTLEKLEYFKNKKESLKLDYVIQVDGGVSDQNSKKLITAGANNLVAGSYIFKNKKENYPQIIETLRT